MSRYIDAEQKITITYYDEEHEEWSKKTKTIDEFLYENADEDIPTADVREVVHARWINDRGVYKCSHCKELWLEWWASQCPIESMNKLMRLCPKCGAQMDERRS